MTDLFAITQIGMQNGSQRLATLGSNAAHASVPGHKRQMLRSNVPFVSHLDPTGAPSNLATLAGEAMRGLDLRPGGLRETGRALDAAVDGAGAYFGLTDGQTTYLTRGGRFSVDSSGYLVGEQGLRVLGTQGEIRLQAGADVNIRPNGEIVQRGEVQAILQLLRPGQDVELTPLSGALMRAEGAFDLQDPAMNSIKPNALEASNAAGPQDMTSLMTTARQFESLVRITQGYDDVLGRFIQKIGEA